MKTIGAKELRLNLDAVLDRVIAGEEITVQHRFKQPVKLSPVSSQTPHTRLAGLKAFNQAPKQAYPFDVNQSLADLYRQSLTRKYGSIDNQS